MTIKITSLCFSFLIILAFSAIGAEKLSPEKAGTIAVPTGQIAFIRSGDIWVMKADGSNQQNVTEVKNAEGRLCWSPDNKTIAFTRFGSVDLKGPDNLGGFHKVYDIFLAYMDSVYANNRMFWRRVTDDVGSRDPQWLPNNRIVYWKDMNANQVNSFLPNYQICTMEPDGGMIELLRKDWQNFNESFMTQPSMNSKGDLVFVYFEKLRPVGLVTIGADEYMSDIESFKVTANNNKAKVAPSWSPDNKWISYISNDMDDAGLYITTPDMKETYLVASPPVGTYMRPMPASFSPDSKWLTFSTTDGSIWVCKITGESLRRLSGPGADSNPAWSN